MTTLQGDVKFYKAARNDNTTLNGGPLDDRQRLRSGIQNNTWRHFTAADIAAGLTLRRKIYTRWEDPGNSGVGNGGIYLARPLPAPLEGYIQAGTRIDVESELLPAARRYGAALTDASFNAGVSVITCLVTNPAVVIFEIGDQIRVQNGPFSFFEVLTNVSLASNQYTLTLTGTTPWAIGLNAVVSSVYLIGATAQATIVESTLVSAAGTYEEANDVPEHAGAIYERFLFNFLTATTFTVQGLVYPARVYPNGSTLTTYAPLNPVTGFPYLTLPASVWGGTFAPGDFLILDVDFGGHQAWQELIIPAATPAFTDAQFILGATGTS